MKNKFLIFMATITFFLTVAVVGILLKPELYESKTTVIKENDSMQSEVDEKNIESEVSNQEEWGSGDVYDGSSPIIRKMGEKLSVIGIPHRKQGDKPPMSTEVFAYSPAFLDGYSAYDNLRYMASVKNKVSGEEIKDLLKKVELADAGKKKYKYFSLGMKQRLGIAAAIMEHPDIILIDEPTNALDSKGVEMVKCILQQEKERGALIVLTCHDYSVLKELSDSIYFIEEGRVVGYERQ